MLTDWTLREIGELFTGNGFVTRTAELPEPKWPIGSSVRRAEAAGYLELISRDNPEQSVALLHVYSDVLMQMPECVEKDRLQRLLEDDGVTFSGPARIDPRQFQLERPSRLKTALPDFTLISDPAVLREHAERMQHAIAKGDPPDAILAARELVETVLKLVCEDYGVATAKNPSVGELYKSASTALGLDAASVGGDDEAKQASRKVLSGLARIADGLGELRTRVGRGHGRTTSSPARQRHAELATGSAATLAIFVLDTWQERRSE